MRGHGSDFVSEANWSIAEKGLLFPKVPMQTEVSFFEVALFR
jgi:hypothetical protein